MYKIIKLPPRILELKASQVKIGKQLRLTLIPLTPLKKLKDKRYKEYLVI
jgi:hypothetical protein